MKTLLLSLLLACQYAVADITLTPDNTYIIMGNITKYGALQFVDSLMPVALNPTQDYYILIMSNGGDLEASVLMSEQVKKYPNLHSIVVYAASGAAAVTQSVGGKRYMGKNSMLMFHEVAVEASERLTRAYTKLMTEDLARDEDVFDKLCYSKLSISKKEYKKRTLRNDYYVNAQEATAIGASDAIETLKCSDELLQITNKSPSGLTVYSWVSGWESRINWCEFLEAL